jgi:hypothetical protein
MFEVRGELEDITRLHTTQCCVPPAPETLLMNLIIIAARSTRFMKSISGSNTTVFQLCLACVATQTHLLSHTMPRLKGTKNLSMLQNVRGFPLQQLYN